MMDPAVHLSRMRRFDFNVISCFMTNLGLFERLCDNVNGCVDSINVFKTVTKSELPSYSLTNLCTNVLNIQYNAHDAWGDCEATIQLWNHYKCTNKHALDHSVTPSGVWNSAKWRISVNQNIDSLVPLIGAGIMKRPTAENIAGSGLNLHHLRVIARRDTGDGSDNLRAAFTMLNSERKPRVTNH